MVGLDCEIEESIGFEKGKVLAGVIVRLTWMKGGWIFRKESKHEAIEKGKFCNRSFL